VTRREKIALGICIFVHAAVVWNVYEFDKLTPRIVIVESGALCKRALDPKPDVPHNSVSL